MRANHRTKGPIGGGGERVCLCQRGQVQLGLGCHRDGLMRLTRRHLEATQGSH